MEHDALHVCATFSVVALDAASGWLGSAVASKYFAVGAAVYHFKQGVGVVNSQSWCNRRLAVHALELMQAGATPEEALKMVLATDDKPQLRQVLAIDAKGQKAAWTGDQCTPERHHVIGRTCVAAGNTLASADMVEAMAAVMDSSPDVPFGLRLLKALQAAEELGGDKRGKQSAAVALVPATFTAWESDCLNIRADDSEDPLKELMRLYEKGWKDSGF